MEDTNRDTWAAAFGTALREWREKLGWRPEDMASLMRTHGFQWSRSVVAAVESGRRTVRHEEFLVMCAALGRAPWEWFADEGAIRVGQDRVLTFEQVRAVYSGRQVELVERLTPERVDAGLAAVAERLDRVWPDRPHRIDVQQAWITSGGEAEFHAARQLSRKLSADLAPLHVSIFAHGLWGRGLTDERDARVTERVREGASERTVQAHRGHVTRELLRDLERIATKWRDDPAHEGSSDDE